MLRRDLLALATGALALATAVSVSAQTPIKIGSVAPKTGALAGGAVVTQWPNVELWAAQVNERGRLERWR